MLSGHLSINLSIQKIILSAWDSLSKYLLKVHYVSGILLSTRDKNKQEILYLFTNIDELPYFLWSHFSGPHLLFVVPKIYS